MANVGTLSIKFTGDAKQLEQTFTRVGVKANLFSNAITAGLRTASQAAIDFAKSSIRIAAQNEQTITSFANLTGSIGAAKNLYKELLDFSSRTPFSSKEIQSGATTLLGFGLSAKEATAAIKDLGAAAAANADTDLKRLVVSFGQIQGANVAMTKDLREFVNNGIPIYQLLSDTLGVSVEKINEMASAGQITGDVITRVFAQAAAEGGRFATTLDTQSKTLNGLISTLKDNFAIVLGQLGEKLLPVLKDAVLAANESLLRFREAIDAGELNPFIAGVSTMAKSLGVLVEAGRDAIGTFVGLVKAIQAAYAASRLRFAEAWEHAKGALTEYTRAVVSVTKIKERLGEITSTYNTELAKLNVATASAGDFMEDYSTKGDAAVTTTNNLSESTGKARPNMDALWQSIQQVGSQLNVTLPKMEAMANFFKDFGARGAPSLPQLGVREGGVTGGAPAVSTGLERTDEELLAQMSAETDKYQESLNLASQAAQHFGNVFRQAHEQGIPAVQALARATVSAAREIIAAKIREGVLEAAVGALKNVPFPFNIVLAGIAAGAAEALFRSLLSSINIPAFGDGGIVYKPTLALIGEKGPEVITPLGGRGNNQLSVAIRGVQYGADTYWQNANVGIVGRMIYGPQ